MPRIARIWFGETPASDFDAYLEYLMKTGVVGLQETPGNQGVLALRRQGPETAEFGIISFWNDDTDIRKFAGKEIERAFYYPEDDRYLIRKEPYVKHFEISFISVKQEFKKTGS